MPSVFTSLANFCHPRSAASAKPAIDSRGFKMLSLHELCLRGEALHRQGKSLVEQPLLYVQPAVVKHRSHRPGALVAV